MENTDYIWKFIWAVLNNWAGYFTGGIFIAIVTVWFAWRQKTMERKFLKYLLICFLVMAVFKAWKDEYIAATPEMAITVLVQNSSKNKIQIYPKFIGSFEESAGNSESDSPDEAFRLFSKGKNTDESSFVIPAGKSKAYEITIPDTVNKKAMFEKGASDFIFTLYDGDEKAVGAIPFNKDSINAHPAVVNFKN